MVIGNVRIAPVDVELGVVSTPVDARHVAIAEARTSAEGDVTDVEVLTGLRPVLQLEHQTLQQSHAVDALLF